MKKRVTAGTVEPLRVLDDKLVTMIFYDEARKVNPTYEISLKCSQNIIKALNSKKPNIQIKLVDNFYFIKEYDSWKFSFIDNVDYEFKILSPSKIDNEYFYLDFTKDSSNRNVTPEDYPLTIRNAKDKDKIKVKNYDVEVRRLFIDWKMPVSLRKRWPIILDKNNKPIYIPRYQKYFIKDKDLNFYVK